MFPPSVWARLLQSRPVEKFSARICNSIAVPLVRQPCSQDQIRRFSAVASSDLTFETCQWHPFGLEFFPKRIIELKGTFPSRDRSELIIDFSPSFQKVSKSTPGDLRLSLLGVLESAPDKFLRHATWSKMADTAAIERQLAELEEPEKPYPEDCCGGGCAPCVWDTYYEELEAFEMKKEALLEAKAQLERESEGRQTSEEGRKEESAADGEDIRQQSEAPVDR